MFNFKREILFNPKNLTQKILSKKILSKILYKKPQKKILKKEKFLTKKNPKNPLTIYTHYIYFAPSSSLSLIKKY